ncbi:MAG: tetratricopeptide repeat protein [Elusimicrobia bacterium]|nr:tetratricopeptide repeat protein [Elusimicrobiota bacterium]
MADPHGGARPRARGRAFFQFALALGQGRKFDRAVPALRRVIALNPEHHVALNYLGYSWADRGEIWRKPCPWSVAPWPGSGKSRLSGFPGLGFFRLGRWDEAIAALESAAPIAADAVVWRHSGTPSPNRAGGTRPAAWRKPIWPIRGFGNPSASGSGGPDDVTDLSGPRVLPQAGGRNLGDERPLRGGGRGGPGGGRFSGARVRAVLLRPPRPIPFRTVGAAAHAANGFDFRGRPVAVVSGIGAIDVDQGRGSRCWAVFSPARVFPVRRPAVTVRVEGGHLVYSGPAGELRLDLKNQNPLSLSVPDPSGRRCVSPCRPRRSMCVASGSDGGAGPNGVALTFRFSPYGPWEKDPRRRVPPGPMNPSLHSRPKSTFLEIRRRRLWATTAGLRISRNFPGGTVCGPRPAATAGWCSPATTRPCPWTNATWCVAPRRLDRRPGAGGGDVPFDRSGSPWARDWAVDRATRPRRCAL